MLTPSSQITVSVVGGIKSGKGIFTKKAFEPKYQATLEDTVLLGNNFVPKRSTSIREEGDKKLTEESYFDPKTFIFPLQMDYLGRRHGQQNQVDAADGLVWMGQHPDVDRMFADMNKTAMGDNFPIYERLFNETRRRITEPDVVIYLRASEETLRRRISEKGTLGEKKILEGDYITRHIAGLEKYCDGLKQPAIVIDANHPAFEGKGDDSFWNGFFTTLARDIRSMKKPPRYERSEWGKMDYNRARRASWDAMMQLREYLKKEQAFIALMGIVGSGKTGLTERIQDELGIEALFELGNKNDQIQDEYFQKFIGSLKYAETNIELVRECCYKLQDYLIPKRSGRSAEKYKEGKSFVVDRSAVEDQSIFWRYFLSLGWLSEDQYHSLQEKAISEYAKTPKSDLIIRLNLPGEEARMRVLDRGRKEEVEGWPIERLKAMEVLYDTIEDDMVQYKSHDGPILRVDMTTFNPKNEIDRGQFYQNWLHLLLDQRGT